MRNHAFFFFFFTHSGILVLVRWNAKKGIVVIKGELNFVNNKKDLTNFGWQNARPPTTYSFIAFAWFKVPFHTTFVSFPNNLKRLFMWTIVIHEWVSKIWISWLRKVRRLTLSNHKSCRCHKRQDFHIRNAVHDLYSYGSACMVLCINVLVIMRDISYFKNCYVLR